MAKQQVRQVRKATAREIDILKSIDNSIRGELGFALNDIAGEATLIAKQKIIDTDHTQKYGNELAEQVGYKVNTFKSGGGYAEIIAPYKDNTEEMRAQMYYLEYGAGLVSGEKWGYFTTPHDKNPKKGIKKTGKDKGKWVAITDYSKPAGYMTAARRYLVNHAQRDIASRINLILTRKYYKAKRKSIT